MDRLQGVCLSPPQALKTPEGTSRGNGWVVLIGYLKKLGHHDWIHEIQEFSAQTPASSVSVLWRSSLELASWWFWRCEKPEKICERPKMGGPEANSWSFDRLFLGCLSFKRSFCIVDLRVEMLVKHEHEKTIKTLVASFVYVSFGRPCTGETRMLRHSGDDVDQRRVGNCPFLCWTAFLHGLYGAGHILCKNTQEPSDLCLAVAHTNYHSGTTKTSKR